MDYINLEGNICPICGLDQEEDIQFLMGSICLCCGTEYQGAYVVFAPARAARQQWIDEGYPWFSPNERPVDWDPIAQLNQIPEEYR